MTEFINKGSLFVFSIYAANALGSEAFGHLSFALSVLALVTIFSDFGLSIFLIKKVAQHKSTKDEYASLALVQKCLLNALIIAAALGYLSLTHASNEVRAFIFIAGIGLVINSYAQVMSSVLKGLNLMIYDGASRIFCGILNATGGIVALMWNYGIIGIGVGTALVSAFYSFLTYLINRRLKLVDFSVDLRVPVRKQVHLFKQSLPFGTLAVLATIYFRIDTVMLQHMRNAVEVGMYNAAYRLFEAMLVIPSVFSLVILPALSEAVTSSNNHVIESITQKAIKYFSYLSLPIAVIVTLTADQIIALFYPIEEYSQSVQALQILIWAVVAVFISGTTSTLINSSRLPGINTWIALVMVILNISLNLFMIPRWGLIGASVATVITEFSGIFINTLYIRKVFYPIHYLPHLYRPGLASLLMGLVIYYTHSLFLLPLYLFIYLITLISFGGLSLHELHIMKTFFQLRVSQKESVTGSK